MSTYTDREIEVEVRQGRLIASDFVRANLHQACYELRMGDVYYDLSEGNKRIPVSVRGTVLIKPLHRVVLITKEKLKIPHNVIARITSKGSLFSIGLSPVSTYADPGFVGQIGLVTQNISDKYIDLPVGESIAKVEFSLLTGDVLTPYQGQHGFQTQIWPIKSHLQKDFADVSADVRMDSELAEAYRVTPRATGELLKYLYRRQRWVVGIALLSLFSNTLIVFLPVHSTELVWAFAINLISAAVIGLIAIFQKAPWEEGA